jgi:PAS domain-containing protein
MIWSIDLHYKLTSANETVLSTYELEYGRNIFIGENVLEGLPKDDYKYWRSNYDKTFAGETFKSELLYNVKAGIRILEYTFTPIKENEVVTGLFVTSNDITAFKKYENEILEREKNLSLIVQSFDDILFEIDSNHTIINVWSNDNSKLDYPLNEIIGRKVIEFGNSELGPKFEDLISKVFISGETLKHEFELNVKDNKLWFLANISMINNEQPRISIKLEEITLK